MSWTFGDSLFSNVNFDAREGLEGNHARGPVECIRRRNGRVHLHVRVTPHFLGEMFDAPFRETFLLRLQVDEVVNDGAVRATSSTTTALHFLLS